MATVLNPDEGLYIINGNVNITDSLTVGGDSIYAGIFEITNTSDVDIDNPVYGTAALNVAGGTIIKGNLYVMGHIVAMGDVVTLGSLDAIRSMMQPGDAIMDPDGNIIQNKD